MSHRPVMRRLAILLSLFVLAASAVVALPVVSLPGHPPKALAHATTSLKAGDVVFTRGGYIYKHTASGDSSVYGSDVNLIGQVDVSPDGSKIAFVRSPASGCNGFCLYVINSDGSGLTQVTDHTSSTQANDSYPRWSRDGQWLTFIRYEQGASPDTRDVYKIHPDGSSGTKLTTHGAAASVATWAPDGTRIAYERVESGNNNIWVVGADGSNNHRVTSSARTYQDVTPAWSPNGQRIYFASTQNSGSSLYSLMYYQDTGATPFASAGAYTANTLLAYSSGNNDDTPRPSANGSTVFFNSDRDPSSGSGYTHIHSVTSAGGSLTELSAGNQSDVDPSPFGSPTDWWSGAECNVNNHSGSDQFPVGASDTAEFVGVMACGPGDLVTRYFYSGAHGELEWQCVELVMRYMWLMFGVPPYAADGYQVAQNYSGSAMQVVTDSQTTNPPAVGDVLEIKREAPFNLNSGHTGIVTGNTGGNITFLEQNGSSTGYSSVSYSSNDVAHVDRWLHPVGW